MPLDPSNKHGRKLCGLQGLRALGAFLVLWAHLKFAIGNRDYWLVSTALGGIGVDIFFVISGFVISLTAARIGRDALRFMGNRIFRVVPLYFTLSLAYWLCITVLDRPQEISLFNTFAFLPIFDTGRLVRPVHPYGWTLCYEMWFYLAFAALILWKGGLQASRLLPRVLGTGTLVMLLFYRGRWYLPQFLFNPLVLEFCAGCLLYQYRHRMNRLTFRLMLGVGALLLAVAVMNSLAVPAMLPPDERWENLQRAGIWGGFAVCLVGAVVYGDLHRSITYPAFLLVLGEASYSIYLIQPFFNLVADVWMRHTPASVRALFYVVGSVSLGVLMWKTIELPLNRWLRARAVQIYRRHRA